MSTKDEPLSETRHKKMSHFRRRGTKNAAIEEFASAGKIGYVHFRNVSEQLPRYSEVFIDDGYVDMKKAMSIYERCGSRARSCPTTRRA